MTLALIINTQLPGWLDRNVTLSLTLIRCTGPQPSSLFSSYSHCCLFSGGITDEMGLFCILMLLSSFSGSGNTLSLPSTYWNSACPKTFSWRSPFWKVFWLLYIQWIPTSFCVSLSWYSAYYHFIWTVIVCSSCNMSFFPHHS